jgi:3'(2'), 5'-bisphosphate nucleotidase
MDDALLVEPLRAIARAAGTAIMAYYDSDPELRLKIDASPLTAADSAAHDVIVKALDKLEPRWPVLSEESAVADIAGRREWPCYWLVDPLDGTKEFLKHNGEFTVNIALIDGHRPRLGVVYAPARDVEYWGSAATGAWCRRGTESRAIHVTSRAPPQPRVVGSRSHGNAELTAYLARLGPHRLSSIGSSLKICLVAEGQADLYPRFGPTMEWDTAAAQAVLESAGGCMMDLAGRALRYNTKGDLKNPHFLAFGDRERDWLV